MQAKRGSITASELLSQLEADPEWVKRRDVAEQERADQGAELKKTEFPLLADLRQVGVRVSSVWDLVNISAPYPQALPLLLDHLSRPYADAVLEGIARALAVKDARPIAWTALIDLVRTGSLPDRAADGAMAALSAMARPADLPILVDLIADRSLGPQRVFLVGNLMRSKKPEARDVLLRLLNDPDLRNEFAARLQRPS